MEENNMNYECEPMEEPSYTPCPHGEPEKPKKKKNHTTAKIVALVAVVALVASIGGSVPG